MAQEQVQLEFVEELQEITNDSTTNWTNGMQNPAMMMQ